MTGLEFFRRIASGEIPHAPMLQLLGLRLVEADEGRVAFTATPGEAHYNGMGIVHGGLAAALIDSATGCAINSALPEGMTFTTLELRVTFTRPLHRDVGEVTCEARVIHLSRRVGTAEARVVDAAGRLYAHGTATCIRVERADGGKDAPSQG